MHKLYRRAEQMRYAFEMHKPPSTRLLHGLGDTLRLAAIRRLGRLMKV